MKVQTELGSTTVAPATTALTALVTLLAPEWPVILALGCEGGGTTLDPAQDAGAFLTIRRHANGTTLVGHAAFEDRGLAEYTVMATTETTPAAIDKVCAHLQENNPGYCGPLVASLKEKYAAIPEMKVTTNYAADQSVTVNPDQWPVVCEASKDVDEDAMASDYDTATLRLHRHADGRALVRATVTDICKRESDYGFFVSTHANLRGQMVLDTFPAMNSIRSFLEFRDRNEEWMELIQEFQAKMNVALAPTPAKKARKARLAKASASPSSRALSSACVPMPANVVESPTQPRELNITPSPVAKRIVFLNGAPITISVIEGMQRLVAKKA